MNFRSSLSVVTLNLQCLKYSFMHVCIYWAEILICFCFLKCLYSIKVLYKKKFHDWIIMYCFAVLWLWHFLVSFSEAFSDIWFIVVVEKNVKSTFTLCKMLKPVIFTTLRIEKNCYWKVSPISSIYKEFSFFYKSHIKHHSYTSHIDLKPSWCEVLAHFYDLSALVGCFSSLSTENYLPIFKCMSFWLHGFCS